MRAVVGAPRVVYDPRTLTTQQKTVLVTGGAGYVGAVLVPELLRRGHRVRVLDLYLYGRDVLDAVKAHPQLTEIVGDIRSSESVRKAVDGVDVVIHLACISNDPSFELDPELGRSINFDAFEPLVDASVAAGVERFIFASSSSVYGVSDAPVVDEDHPLNPLTDYSRYKAMCEPILFSRQSPSFTTVAIRPATLCGYSPRQRLDLTLNILTTHAYHRGKIRVFGGEQLRPHLHIKDMCRYYVSLVERSATEIAGRVWNASAQEDRVADLAKLVGRIVGERLERNIGIETVPTDDPRSYRAAGHRIRDELGLAPAHTIQDAITELVDAFEAGLLPDAFDADRYHNVRLMKRMSLG
jgi:nucleoside-diphosphate-sugar epimerase